MVVSTGKQNKKASSEVTEQVEIVEKNVDSLEKIRQQVEETKRSPLDEMVKQAEKAYIAYNEAEKQLAGTYRENEVRAVKDCELAQQRAQNDFEEQIAGTLKEREETITRAVETHSNALRRAEEALQKTKQEADNICQEKISKAQCIRSNVVEEALNVRDITIGQDWAVYSKMKR